MICSCHADGACEHRVAAILAFQVAKGRRQIEAGARSWKHRPAVRTREEVLESVGLVLREMTALGLLRRRAPRRTVCEHWRSPPMASIYRVLERMLAPWPMKPS